MPWMEAAAAFLGPALGAAAGRQSQAEGKYRPISSKQIFLMNEMIQALRGGSQGEYGFGNFVKPALSSWADILESRGLPLQGGVADRGMQSIYAQGAAQESQNYWQRALAAAQMQPAGATAQGFDYPIFTDVYA